MSTDNTLEVMHEHTTEEMTPTNSEVSEDVRFNNVVILLCVVERTAGLVLADCTLCHGTHLNCSVPYHTLRTLSPVAFVVWAGYMFAAS